MFGLSSVKPRICNRVLLPRLVRANVHKHSICNNCGWHTQFSFLLFAAVKPVPKDKGVLKVLGKHFRFLVVPYVLKSNAGIIDKKEFATNRSEQFVLIHFTALIYF